MLDQETIHCFKNGNQEAFKALYDAYWEKVYGFTKLYLSRQEDREDVVQEVFFRLWDKRHLLDADKDLDGFLFILTKNMILNKLRRRKLKSLDGVDLDIPDSNAEPDLNDPYLSTYIDKLISTMPTKQREAFILRRKEGLSIKEISEAMNISESGVKRNINLALKFLKANLPLFILFVSFR
ncbi:MAG: RNA polymerase sigma factor [Candidatus Cryptobacteroides sp.]